MESWKLVLFKGVFCSTVCNVIFITSNKIIIQYSLSGNNINFFKGLLQTILFLFIVSIKNACRKEETDKGNNDHLEEQANMIGHNDNGMTKPLIRIKGILNKCNKVIWLLIFGVCYGLVFLSFNLGSKEIPLSFFVTIIATTPIFALLFGRCIIKTKITLLKTVTCLSLILGICMVMYEGLQNLDFDGKCIKETRLKIENTNSTFGRNSVDFLDKHYFGKHVNMTIEDFDEKTDFQSSNEYTQIYLGIISAFVFAILGALANVIPAKCNDISWCVMMLYAGVGSLLCSIIANFFAEFELNIWVLERTSYTSKTVVELTVGFFGMTANGLLILANRLSSPTINSVVRRSEIILVLLYDVIWLKDYPDIIEGCGYVIVLISVIITTFADQIHKSILQLKNRQSTMQAV